MSIKQIFDFFIIIIFFSGTLATTEHSDFSFFFAELAIFAVIILVFTQTFIYMTI